MGGGEFTYLRVAAGVVSATAVVHSVERHRVARLRAQHERDAKLGTDSGAIARRTKTFAQRSFCSWRGLVLLEVSTA